MKTTKTLTPIARGLFVAGVLFACNVQSQRQGNLYFLSVQEAVSRIGNLLRDNEWKTLSEYYDLTGSPLERATLQSGVFFMRTEAPAAPDPAGLWRYRHPFAPGFIYFSDQPSSEPNVLTVVVVREIDQGGGPKQRVLGEFKMRKSARGFQILPP